MSGVAVHARAGACGAITPVAVYPESRYHAAVADERPTWAPGSFA